jgi:hypothetical protein
MRAEIMLTPQVREKKVPTPLAAARQGIKTSIYRDLVEKYQSFMA